MANYVITHKESGSTYDPIENKFYSPNWSPQFTNDLEYLEQIMKDDPQRFQGCVIIQY